MTRPANDLLHGPIVPTLLRLAIPNVFAMAAATAVGIGETIYVGLLGTTALAAMALVFPFVMLMQMFSAGAMGGGVSSAIARALGAQDLARARALAVHAVTIGAGAGLVFMVAFELAGPALFESLGGRGAVLDEAVRYGRWVFLATPAIWLCNTLISLARGTGNMRVPSTTILAVSAAQVAIGASFGLGLFGLPRLGMQGVALGQLVAYTAGAAALWWYVRRGPTKLRLVFAGTRLAWPLFADILKVGALACLSPLLTISTVLVVTSLVATHGNAALAGYGVGSRLEFLLVPIAFGIGVAAVPMVGMAMGAGNAARARQVAWRAGAMAGVLLGAIGLTLMAWPDLWAAMFTRDEAVLAQARSYLRWAGPGFGFFGLGLVLYFAAQGSGNVVAPVIASFLRFAFVVVGGLVLQSMDAPAHALFGLVGGAMVVYGGATALGVWASRWGPAAATPARA